VLKGIQVVNILLPLVQKWTTYTTPLLEWKYRYYW